MSTDEELIEGLRKGVESGEWVEMTRIPRPQDTLWVCDQCLFAREGDGLPGPCGCEPAHEPWALGAGTDVTLGVFEHDHWCTDEDRTEGCDCGEINFRIAACDGCGCPLAGRRIAYTWWA